MGAAANGMYYVEFPTEEGDEPPPPINPVVRDHVNLLSKVLELSLNLKRSRGSQNDGVNAETLEDCPPQLKNRRL